MANKKTMSVKKPKPEYRKAKEEEIKKKIVDKALVEEVIDNNIKNQIPEDYKYCCSCGQDLPVEKFSKSRSNIYKDGRIHICSDCIYDLIDKYYSIYGDLKDVLIIICSITNTIVIKEPLDETLKEYAKSRSRKREIYEYYLKLLEKYIIDNNTWNKSYLTFESSNFGGKPFKKCCVDDTLYKILDMDILNTDSKESDDDDEDDVELTPQQRKRLVKKWGDKEDVDLIWLDEREKSYYETHDIPNDHINKSGVITLCNLELQEFRTLCDGGDVKQILDSKNKVLAQTSFSPKKKAKEEGVSNSLDLGSLIKKREEFSPIINNDPELDDVDKIKNISKALAGALCRTAKIESPLVEEFEKVMKDYTFEFSPNGDYDD